ncbi:PREDICTED: leukotriene C4 synthase [Apaloderma vittatum]|uniref:leukotriene C4 synthase n=1 Tax=Apaloderma vittatum TaxID=57397 RepID=UPI0005214EE7|nr:PREDICTED: leukotriene C4 synthase [Apaloderma vittatum]
MRDQIDLLATVTVLGVLEQAYFAMQVIYARRKYKISPPETTGHPEFERIFRAQANCSEYFPIFTSLLWVAGIFFHQGWHVVLGRQQAQAELQHNTQIAASDRETMTQTISHPPSIPYQLGLKADVYHPPVHHPWLSLEGGWGDAKLSANTLRIPGGLGVSMAFFSPHRLGPLYASARLLWLLLGLAGVGLLAPFVRARPSPWMAAPWMVRPLQLLSAQ